MPVNAKKGTLRVTEYGEWKEVVVKDWLGRYVVRVLIKPPTDFETAVAAVKAAAAVLGYKIEED